MLEQITITKVESNAAPKADTLSIKRSRGEGHFKGYMNVLKFQDKDTNQFISYCSCFDLSGYGETQENAIEMLKFSVHEYFKYLISLTPKQMEAELTSLGWKQNKIWHKQYSKAFADINGELQNFNALDNKVERMALHAA